MTDFNTIIEAIDSSLNSMMPHSAAVLVECILAAVCAIGAYLVFAIIMIYMERKVCAAFQCRVGPDRVGKWGILQVFSDVFKMLIKEIIDIKNSDRILYNLAPFLVVMSSLITFSCLPFARGLQVLDFNIGIFFIMAASSFGILGILLAGWSSNNKFSMIGAIRSGGQMISYELSMGLSILTLVVLSGSMQISELVEEQTRGWFIFRGHIPAVIAFIMYIISGNAETNRAPFDLPEAESELTAGFHTEYSGMGFGLFYVAEFMNMFIIAGIASTIFLGGWAPLYISGLDGFNEAMCWIPGIVWFLGKTFFVIWLLMWIRWTFPRLRIDQVLVLEWKYMVPIGLLNLLIMTICVVMGWTF